MRHRSKEFDPEKCSELHGSLVQELMLISQRYLGAKERAKHPAPTDLTSLQVSNRNFCETLDLSIL